jgi:hypothetical protein
VYWEYNHHWLRQFIEAVIHYVNKTPLYKVDAPTNVETNIMQCENGDLLLNFIHYQIGHQGADMSTPSMEKVFPITGIHCAIKIDKIKKLILEPIKQDIQYEIKDGYAHFDLPSIHYMAMVRIVR